jgi:hypothetical protein
VVNLYFSSDNAIIRYNIFKDEYVPNGSTAVIALTGSDGVKIYGNVFSNFRSGDAAIGFDGSNSINTEVYNNTIDSCNSSTGGQGGVKLANSPTNLIYNNIFTNCANINFTGTHNYNVFPDNNARGETSAQLNFLTSQFVNYVAKDFRLVSPTVPGSVLGALYSTDPLGNTRGADGVWDRGAYEFVSGAPPSLQGDLNLDGTVNTLDWSLMNAVWFTADSTADINHDGIVNSIDFGLMNRNWGQTA